MRGAIIIALVVVGGLLVATPLWVHHLHESGYRADVVRLLEKPGATNVNLPRGDSPTGMQVACVLLGAVIGISGVALAVRELRSTRPENVRPPN